jgi:hypothetical protein
MNSAMMPILKEETYMRIRSSTTMKKIIILNTVIRIMIVTERKLNRALFLLSIMLITISCSSDEESPYSQEYLFAVHYENMAWNPTSMGFVINKKGDVSTYDLSTMNGQISESLVTIKTEDELSAIFEKNYSWKEQIDTDTLRHYQNKILMISDDTLSEPQSVCADAGRYEYVVFHYNESTGEYTGVLVYQSGDWMIENSLNDAIAIKNWLIKLALKYEIAYEYGGICSGV